MTEAVAVIVAEWRTRTRTRRDSSFLRMTRQRYVSTFREKNAAVGRGAGEMA